MDDNSANDQVFFEASTVSFLASGSYVCAHIFFSVLVHWNACNWCESLMKSLNIVDIFAFKSVASNEHWTLPIHALSTLGLYPSSTLSAALKHGLPNLDPCVCAQVSWMWIGNGFSINHRPKYKWFPTTGSFEKKNHSFCSCKILHMK